MRAWLEWVGPLPGDRWTLSLLVDRPITSGPLVHLSDVMGSLGTAPFALLTGAVAIFVVARAYGGPAALPLILSFGVVPLNAALKLLSGTTPLYRTYHESDHNFPSGHAAYAAAVYGTLLVIALRHGRRDVAVAFGVLIAAMGPTRWILGGHLFSDVVAGYLVGAAWLIVAFTIPARVRR
jgi:undecaprenyl-diphosphatase